jgi:hypothetical protein
MKITNQPPVTRSQSTTPAEGPRPPAAPPPEAPATRTGKGWEAGRGGGVEARRAAATSVTTAPVELSEAERAAVVQKKATCPFIGSAVAGGQLPVRNDAEKPLASIDDVAKLGNTGPGSDLGEVLKLFAQGNHAYMAGQGGKLDTPVPLNTFSLDFPGSQGSHPGHSGILQGNPGLLNTGRLSEKDFARLTSFARDGVVSRSDIGKFIAQNVAADPNSKTPSLKTGAKLAQDFAKLLGETGKHLEDKAHGRSNPEQERLVLEKLTKLLGEENLLGSAGEFGLLATFLQGSPKTRTVNGEPAYSVDDLRAMFVEKRLPDGWESWTKTSADWVKNTAAIGFAAEKAYATR